MGCPEPFVGTLTWMTIGVDMPKSRSQSRTIGRNRVALLCGCVLTFLLVACSGPDPTVNVYVDPAIGNDANPGSADQLIVATSPGLGQDVPRLTRPQVGGSADSESESSCRNNYSNCLRMQLHLVVHRDRTAAG